MGYGTLTGFAIKTLGAADHTYVTSSEGHIWPCWGRSKGGQKICEGTGNIDQAECLSRVNSRAGIKYGRTGVCHQTANRILLTAKVDVARAAAAGKSFILYGKYGLDLRRFRQYDPSARPWPELVRCRRDHVHK